MNLEKLRKYYFETPVEELRKDFKEIHKDSVGPLAHEIIEEWSKTN